jgi:hypothetical protein
MLLLSFFSTGNLIILQNSTSFTVNEEKIHSNIFDKGENLLALKMFKTREIGASKRQHKFNYCKCFDRSRENKNETKYDEVEGEAVHGGCNINLLQKRSRSREKNESR